MVWKFFIFEKLAILRIELTILSLLLFIQKADPQCVINNKDYNNLYNWEFFSEPFAIRKNIITDNTNTFHVFFSKKHLIGMAINWKYPKEPETFDICSSFILPKDSVHFSFYCSSLKVDSLLLKLKLYRNNEEFLEQLIFPLNMNGMNKVSLKNTDATVMDVHIYGKSMIRYDSISLKINDFKMFTSGQNLYHALQQYTPVIKNSDAVPLPLIGALNDFKNKKIIGLGESIHGSRSIQEEKKNIIEKLCEDKSIKLICFEAGFDMVMNWDLYIHGVLPESYQNRIMEEVSGSFSEAELTVELLNRLRTINRNRQNTDKIHVVGLDLRRNDYYVFEYFEAYKNIEKSEKFLDDVLMKMDTLSYNQQGFYYAKRAKGSMDIIEEGWEIIPERKRFYALIDLLEKNEKLKKLMGEKNFNFFVEAISLNIPTEKDAFENIAIARKRDEYMWKVLQHAITTYAPNESDRIIIDAHSMHLSRIYNPHSITHTFAIKNLGVYTTESYGNDFHTVTFCVGSGKYKTYNKGSIGEGRLQRPVHGSFEWVADKVDYGKFYCQNTDFSSITSLRYIANIALINQFYPLSKFRFDGYVYLNESTPCTPIQYNKSSENKRIIRKRNYVDSIKVLYAPYKAYKYKIYVDSVSNVKITMPEGFRWKEFFYMYDLNGNLNYPTTFRGFFESNDKNCIVVIDNPQFPLNFPPLNGIINKKDIETETKKSFSQIPGFNQIPEKNNETLIEKHIKYRTKIYAKKVFNADRVAESTLSIPLSDKILVLGQYNFGEAIFIEKDGGTVILKCFYTNKGFKNKRKYRTGIESLVRFK
ncbi:MAG: erythromycin esterase family protein [Dysgonamonadaceae bacterium]|nr:erythromycin esterase family protein [Dysgonamonadaceae bacterium]